VAVRLEFRADGVKSIGQQVNSAYVTKYISVALEQGFPAVASISFRLLTKETHIGNYHQ
jgi:hypothetical protein